MGVKVNCVDTPGFSMFVHEAKAAMLPVESAVVLVDACAGSRADDRAGLVVCRRVLAAAHSGGQQDGPRYRQNGCQRRPARIRLASPLRFWSRCEMPLGGMWFPFSCRSGKGALRRSRRFRGVIDLFR
jgi:hypothetical protein